MKRMNLNFLTDSIAFVAFVLLTVTGFVLEIVLPPGSGRVIGEGTGHRAMTKPIGLLWGLTRHAWGALHLYIAIVLMAVMAVHLVLHWRWIVSVIRGQPRQGSGIRFVLGLYGLLALVLLVVAVFLSPTDWVPRYQLQPAPHPGAIAPQ